MKFYLTNFITMVSEVFLITGPTPEKNM